MSCIMIVVRKKSGCRKVIQVKVEKKYKAVYCIMVSASEK